MTALRIAFRCDASVAIGTGHVVRCLSLARALRERGHAISFVMRDLPGNMCDRVAAEGFAVVRLPAPDAAYQPHQGDPQHAAWAAVSWEVDAAQTATALAGLGLDWVVLDHYAFDIKWEKAAVPAGARLMLLDDLADRAHACDLILDQNLGRAFADYSGLVSAQCRRLIGPRYAILRPEFAQSRPKAVAARQERGLGHILVAMGGVDAPDVTGFLLSVLPEHYQVTVVMGSAAPALASVREKAAARGARVFVDTPDMAALMVEADLAIGGVGGSTWERCALGLPSLMVVMADNQAAAADALAAAGAARLLGRAGDPDLAENLLGALTQLAEQGALAAMARATSRVCDGGGVPRAIQALEAPAVQLRLATMADAQDIWEWRQAVTEAHAFRSGHAGKLAEHIDWMQTALGDPRRVLSIAVAEGHSIGHVRLDHVFDAVGLVSIVLAPKAKGSGWSGLILAAVIAMAQKRNLRLLRAEVHEQNAASLHLFSGAGFTLAERDGAFRVLVLAL